jgi:hypothetical protein
MTRVVRYVVGVPDDGGGWSFVDPRQGRYTYATADEANARAAALLNADTNSPDTLRSVFGPNYPQMRAFPVYCYPGHFDPCGAVDGDEL